MIPFHTIYEVTLVSQATSALVLWLLAWNDRRSRGLVSLASVCTLHAVAIVLLPMWRSSDRWVPEAISAAILPLIFFLTHRGLRPFVRPLEPVTGTYAYPREIAFLLAGVMVGVVALAPWSRLWSMQIARVAAILLMGWSTRMLWQTPSEALQGPARLSAGLLGLIMATLLARLPLEPHAPADGLMLALRELTMVEISLLAFSFLLVYLAESKQRLNSETRLDALTGLLNRRGMEEQAVGELRSAQRTGRPLALLMMDLDGFKQLNDTWGHGVGDRALRAVGDALRASAQRHGTVVARLGGEEFAMLLPDYGIDPARRLAEQLRLAVADLQVTERGRDVAFTVSIGVATWYPGESAWTEMLERADAALYRAKREGRNRVVVCEHAERLEVVIERYPPRRRVSKGVRLLEIDTDRAWMRRPGPLS